MLCKISDLHSEKLGNKGIQKVYIHVLSFAYKNIHVFGTQVLQL